MMLMDWTPVLVWMIAIFTLSTGYFSSAHTVPLIAPLLVNLSLDVETIDHLARKLAHFSEYFILAVLLTRALNGRSAGILAKRHMMWSLAMAVIYSLTDEWHQSFVPGRSARVGDVIIDAIGALCGTLTVYLRNPRTNTTLKLPLQTLR